MSTAGQENRDGKTTSEHVETVATLMINEVTKALQASLTNSAVIRATELLRVGKAIDQPTVSLQLAERAIDVSAELAARLTRFMAALEQRLNGIIVQNPQNTYQILKIFSALFEKNHSTFDNLIKTLLKADFFETQLKEARVNFSSLLETVSGGKMGDFTKATLEFVCFLVANQPLSTNELNAAITNHDYKLLIASGQLFGYEHVALALLQYLEKFEFSEGLYYFGGYNDAPNLLKLIANKFSELPEQTQRAIITRNPRQLEYLYTGNVNSDRALAHLVAQTTGKLEKLPASLNDEHENALDFALLLARTTNGGVTVALSEWSETAINGLSNENWLALSKASQQRLGKANGTLDEKILRLPINWATRLLAYDFSMRNLAQIVDSSLNFTNPVGSLLSAAEVASIPGLTRKLDWLDELNNVRELSHWRNEQIKHLFSWVIAILGQTRIKLTEKQIKSLVLATKGSDSLRNELLNQYLTPAFSSGTMQLAPLIKAMNLTKRDRKTELGDDLLHTQIVG